MIADRSDAFAGDRTAEVMTLSGLNKRIAGLLYDSSVKNVWVTAETSDLRIKGGHCYFELIEKDEAGINIQSRLKAIIWQSVYPKIATKFSIATDAQLASSQKVMVFGSVNYNANFGLSFIINDIEPSYTIGDVELRRRQIIQRLTTEGIIDMNRRLAWNVPSLRIAVISAEGAAGYGDFIHQLYSTPSRIRFSTSLFPALMQGERTPSSIISALERVGEQIEEWDLVVIIRGGGATSDLISFDDYNLAANIANFPLPVIVGIGHERDVTVLDYVANKRVKTPTAAAELIISEAESHLRSLQNTATEIFRLVRERVAGQQTQLAFYAGQIPMASTATLKGAENRLVKHSVFLSGIVERRLSPARTRLDVLESAIASASSALLKKKYDRLSTLEHLLEALSPQATLARGYSITRVNGTALTSVRDIAPGTKLETTLADGTIISETI